MQATITSLHCIRNCQICIRLKPYIYLEIQLLIQILSSLKLRETKICLEKLQSSTLALQLDLQAVDHLQEEDHQVQEVDYPALVQEEDHNQLLILEDIAVGVHKATKEQQETLDLAVQLEEVLDQEQVLLDFYKMKST